MIYDNCTSYITTELEKRIDFKTLMAKTVVFFSLDSLSKTLIHILAVNNIGNIAIIDFASEVKQWQSINVIQDKPEATEFLNEQRSFAFIFTEKSAVTAFEQMEYQLEDKDVMADLSFIRMDYLPNPLQLYSENVPVSLRECQLTILPVLKSFKAFCNKHDLRYYLEGGTLLGAVRHKGFIPWDDDLDIAMPMPDYLKLCNLFPRDGQVFFESMYNEGLKDSPISTLTKLKSKELVTEFSIFPVRMLSGMGLDIFPLCGYPDSFEEQQSYLREFWSLADLWKKDIVISYGSNLFSKERYYKLVKMMEAVALKYDYDTASYVGYAYFGYDNYPALDNTRAMPKAWYDVTIDLQFEDEKYCVPAQYDKVLRKWYGDYMVLPPENEQHPHDSKGIFKITSTDIKEKMFG